MLKLETDRCITPSLLTLNTESQNSPPELAMLTSYPRSYNCSPSGGHQSEEVCFIILPHKDEAYLFLGSGESITKMLLKSGVQFFGKRD